MRKFLNHSTVFGIIIGIVIGSVLTVVIAESINSSEVLYDNSNSSSKSDNVQGALDEVYNTLDKVGSGYSLIAHSPDGLSTELIAGLYRYQGVQDANNTVDNYLCFGTTNRNTCVGDTDKYMYRIIGINTSGQMKLIKKVALNTAYKWYSSGEVDWAHSDLYNGLNGSYFLTNTIYVPDSSWSNRIVVSDWHYWSGTDANMNAATMASTELGAETINAKIGLMYLHDYYYGLEGGNNCSSSGVYSTCKNSWIYNGFEWTISRNTTGYAWCVSSNGVQRDNFVLYANSVRPVFFLNSNETIISGSGTITDPYILS